MLFYFIGFFMLTLIAIITFFIRRHALRKNSIFIKLFYEGLRNENNGDFEEAFVNYKHALIEVNKMRFDYGFRSKIVEKLRILHTVIDYGNSFSHRNTPLSKTSNQIG